MTSVAHTHFLKGDYEQALASYDAAAGYYLDAAILALTSRESEAAGLLARRHSSGVRAGWMRALIESLGALLEGDPARCVELAANALAQPSKDPECKFYLARHLARGGAHAEALKAIGDLLAEGFLCSTALQRDPWLQRTLPAARVRSRFEILRSARGGSKSGVPCRRWNARVFLTVDR